MDRMAATGRTTARAFETTGRLARVRAARPMPASIDGSPIEPTPVAAADERTTRPTRSGPSAAAAGNPTSDLASAQVARFVERGSAIAGLVGDATRERAATGDPEQLDILRRLLLLLEEPGRLDVSTDTHRFHAIYLGSLDIAIALENGPASDIDLWLSQLRPTNPIR